MNDGSTYHHLVGCSVTPDRHYQARRARDEEKLTFEEISAAIDNDMSPGRLRALARMSKIWRPDPDTDLRVEGESFERHEQALTIACGDVHKARQWLLDNPSQP